MFFEKKEGLFIGRFRGLYNRPGFFHGFSMRKGGVSDPPFDTLNLGFNTEDPFAAADENRHRFWRAQSLDSSTAAVPKQIHGDRIVSVLSPGNYPDTDALITNRPHVLLIAQTADCLPVFLVDPEHRAVGMVHAGWRGSAIQITAKTIQAMGREYGSKPERLEAYLGPSIGPCCYSVGEIAGQFETFCVRDGKLDLWKANEDQLVSEGIRTQNIETSRLCTACHEEWFFSHRASGGKTGRMMALIGIAG